ncbi:pancreatic triacylglycerol lipase-like protein, partial [Dinothrombium tinctorium]
MNVVYEIMKYAFAVRQSSDLSIKFVLLTMPKRSQNFIEHFVPAANISESILLSLPFDSKKNTIILIHGWLNNYKTSNGWIQGICNITRDYGPHEYQIIFVDWGHAASSPYYVPAAANVNIVASVIASFLKLLVIVRNANTSRFHIIGFSLGAHIAGFVGLDPAAPLFDGFESNFRIDKDDAAMVEIVHTYSGKFFSGFSLLGTVGKIDIYVNGGERQPNCRDPPFGAIAGLFSSTPSCNHERSIELTAFNFKKFGICQPVAYKCNDYETFLEGQCTECGDHNEKCTLLGIWPQESNYFLTNKASSGRFYLKTRGKRPFC